MVRTPDFNALLTFAANKDQQNRTPASSGFRAAIQFAGQQAPVIGIQNFVDAELVFPGDTVTAEITLLDAGSLSGKLYEGLDFDFFESGDLVGSGVITKIN